VLSRGALTGSRLGGRYEVRSLLGQGGMADVYSAHDSVLGRSVAVKVLRRSVAEGRALARFRHEAEAAAGLAHPNIVPLFDIAMGGDMPFIVMELVAGETLSEVIWRDAPLPPERAAEIGEAVADALAFAHTAGIVHRDVKSGNIMLTPWGHVKVLDFGIARALSRARLTTSLELRGTAEYLSPEQARGDELDGRSDIYSLGAVLFEMLTGRPPFEADSAVAVARMHIEEEPPSVRQLRPAIPAPLEAIVARCLEKDPALRYQRAAQLAADLRRFRSDRSAITAPVPPSPSTDSLLAAGRRRRAAPPAPERSTRRRRRGRTVAVALVSAPVAAVAVLTVPLFIRDEPAIRQRAPVLSAPFGLRAAAGCDGLFKTKVRVSWFPSPAEFADGYAVYRSEALRGPFQKIELLPGRRTAAYTDHKLNTSATYFYALRATSGSRIGPLSSVVQVSTPGFCLF
jgi:eukaryotic-like serine/threonine-protein kinase